MPCDDEQAASTSTAGSVQKLDFPEGVPPLTSLYLYISGSCNLACRHCWITPIFQQENNNGQNIKLSYVKKALQEARPLGLRSVKLTGGEPTIHPQFRDIIAMIANEGFEIIIESNGILFDRQLVQFLKERSPGSFISVSLDGAAAETHDNLRGVKGCFEQAISGIRNLVQAGFHPQLICTLHKGNVSEIEEVISLAEELECESVKFNHVQQLGRGEHFSRNQGLSIPEIIELNNRVEKELIRKSKVRIHFDIPFAFYSIRRITRAHHGRCAVLTILGVLSGGELSLCGIGVNVPALIFGHLEADHLKKVWCESPGLTLLREQVPEQMQGICGNCLHRDICLGNCIAQNFYITGELNSPYNFCRQAEIANLFPESRKREFRN
ncbi:MAG: radical SAM protein [Candidatus Aminicenantes bacterium]|nr:radical SAM protein [Candidatus Aminicenantes bacterium]